MADDLSKFPDLGFDVNEALSDIRPPNLLPQGIAAPICKVCGTQAVYVLRMVELVLRTDEGAEHLIQSKPNDGPDILSVCLNHKDVEMDKSVALSAHEMAVYQSKVQSELVSYDVYWTQL